MEYPIQIDLAFLAGAIFTIGFYIARRGNYVAHGRIQTSAPQSPRWWCCG